MPRPFPRIARATTLFALFVVACTPKGTDVGRASFTGEGSQTVVVSMPASGRVHFDSTGQFDRPSNRNPIKKQWALTIETVADGGVASTSATCDPLEVNLSFSGGETCHRSGHENCTETYRGARIDDCSVPLAAGTTTLRLSLAPVASKQNVDIKRLELVLER